MSRLGDSIRMAREKSGMSAKAVARKCGITEGYLLDVEKGTKIIADAAAARILKAMGAEPESNDFETSSVPDAPVSVPQPQTEPVKKQQAGPVNDVWQDALGGVLKAVPIWDENGKTVGRRMLPTENGKIEGAAPDKVFCLRCGDNSMSGYRLRAGDVLLVVPSAYPQDHAVMVLRQEEKLVARRVTLMEQERVLLQWYDGEPKSQALPIKQAQWLGRAVSCEFRL